MPELPSLERARRMVHENFVGKKITKVDAEPDERLFYETTNELFIKALEGRTVISTDRRGKLFWMVLDTAPHPVFHFGMTGSLVIKGQPSLKYKDFSTEYDSWPPKFTKFILHFEGEVEMAYTDGRRFGKMRLLENPLLEPPISELGFDPAIKMISLTDFENLMSSRKGQIKGVLLDQSFCAGIGNWIADEVLYQAKIHPLQPVTSLLKPDIEALYKSIDYVIKTAVDANADDSKFPDSWIFHTRWSKSSKDEQRIKSTGELVQFITAGGRTSAIVAAQKLHKSIKSKVNNPDDKSIGKNRENGARDKIDRFPGKSRKDAAHQEVPIGRKRKNIKSIADNGGDKDLGKRRTNISVALPRKRRKDVNVPDREEIPKRRSLRTKMKS